MGVWETLSFKDNCHEENKKARAEDVALFNTNNRFNYFFNSVDHDLNFHWFVQGFKKGNKFRWNPLLKHNFPKEFAPNYVDGFDKVD